MECYTVVVMLLISTLNSVEKYSKKSRKRMMKDNFFQYGVPALVSKTLLSLLLTILTICFNATTLKTPCIHFISLKSLKLPSYSKISGRTVMSSERITLPTTIMSGASVLTLLIQIRASLNNFSQHLSHMTMMESHLWAQWRANTTHSLEFSFILRKHSLFSTQLLTFLTHLKL